MNNQDGLRWRKVRRQVLNLNETCEELVPVGDTMNVNVGDLRVATNDHTVIVEETTRSRSTALSPILVEDEDDDVQVCSPRSFNQAQFANEVERATIADDDLQLQLGPAGNGLTQRKRIFSQRSQAPSEKALLHTIDLTSNVDESQNLPAVVDQPLPTQQSKFTCGICLDTLKDEASTVCGHVFCWTCIQTAVSTQKKCPTCRKKLTKSQIHRLYLSGNIS